MQLSTSKAQSMLANAESKMKAFKAKHQKALEKASEGAKTIGSGLIAAGTSWGFGYAQGRFDSTEIAGVPYDLGVGVLALGASCLVDSDAGKFALESVGTGALCSFTHTLGLGAGKEAREKEADEVKADREK